MSRFPLLFPLCVALGCAPAAPTPAGGTPGDGFEPTGISLTNTEPADEEQNVYALDPIVLWFDRQPGSVTVTLNGTPATVESGVNRWIVRGNPGPNTDVIAEVRWTDPGAPDGSTQFA